MKSVLEFINNFKKENYQDELDKFNKEITSKYEIPKIFLEHVFQKHLTSLISEPKKYCYLECGVFWGRTLLVSAIGNPDLLCVGVDNWSLNSEQRCKRNIQKSGLTNVNLVTSDYKNFFEKRIDELQNKKICIYLYDAGHSFSDQKDGLVRVLPYLADEAIILVDDTDEQGEPRLATIEFLKEHPEITLLQDYTRDRGFSVGTMVLKK